METLKMIGRPKEVSWEYDREADVAYISFGKPQEAMTMDLGGGVLLRYTEDSKKIVGFTIIGMSGVVKHLKKQPAKIVKLKS